jgi:Cu2+-exporting ATPase
MKHNLRGRETGHNTVSTPLAAGVSFTARVMLDPAVDAVLMSAPTVVVAINVRQLRM